MNARTGMIAAVADRYGPPEVLTLTSVSMPIPGPNEVRIQIIASAVTASDVFIRGATGIRSKGATRVSRANGVGPAPGR